MTELEVRLRQELQNMAQRLAPADPRPLREPPARDSTKRARWMAPAAAMAAVSVVFGGLILAQRAQVIGPAIRLNERPVPPDPALVAVAGMSGSGLSYSITMMSPRTGRMVKIVARAGTGNGFALSPDSKYIFVVGPNHGAIQIRGISVATGKISFAADGAYPAVSPDSRYLAYATGRKFTKLAVRDLRTGSTRVINLRSLIGKDGNLLNEGTVTWLGDGTEILAVPGGIAVATGSALKSVAGATATAGAARADGVSSPPLPPLRAVVLRIRPGRLSARTITIPGPSDSTFTVISGDLSKPRSFLVARSGSGAARGTLDEVSLNGGSVADRRIAWLPRAAMPVAIAPDGDRLLYLIGHTPPALWAATVRNGGLTGQHHLFTDSPKFEFDQAAW